MKKLFVTGVPVTGDGFTGRSKELSQLEYFLENGQSVVVIAPRRFGKTLLILKVLEKVWEELTTAQIETLFRITGSQNERLYSKNPRGINIARSIKSLLLKGTIKKTGKGKYKIIDPYFQEFLLRNK
jgi:hypothetical protein